jgi:alkanesulfonate monooxygenase SsuD/methylene tetrahydromethanopterin reductase-like flavin-dependent oxidoreductase (luciferase family)
MKFGIVYQSSYHGVDPDTIMAYAKHAEDSGFESFYVPEHIVLYPGAALGSAPIEPSLPIHVGGSTRAAARRAGLRGDGYFVGGAVGSRERALQIDLMRTTAIDSGRDADSLEYTRWGSIDMSHEDVEMHAEIGTTRLVVGSAALDHDAQREEISAFGERLKLSPATSRERHRDQVPH